MNSVLTIIIFCCVGIGIYVAFRMTYLEKHYDYSSEIPLTESRTFRMLAWLEKVALWLLVLFLVVWLLTVLFDEIRLSAFRRELAEAKRSPCRQQQHRRTQ
jgi:hypothetical protein